MPPVWLEIDRCDGRRSNGVRLLHETADDDGKQPPDFDHRHNGSNGQRLTDAKCRDHCGDTMTDAVRTVMGQGSSVAR